jgi:arginine deiminase
MKFCWERLGYQVIGEIPEPFTLEGGDFIPAGRDLCFIGTGLRTDDGAVKYMLEKDMFGTRRVAVVRDIFDRDQDRMHLDCVFNILAYDCCVVLETIMGETSLQRRLVTEYTRSQNGEYRITQLDVEFSKYLRDRGFNIVSITHKDRCLTTQDTNSSRLSTGIWMQLC